ncbi:hypothetical protein OPV22_012564 [Ensete ventricosum]|uniref:MPN domain-containing protein n=1 Tax=Ensete ventricosum TaxID=4639 RepID=A0AAV8R5D5_ENSVE|nr:hypothetical protein OPV22_012564 [Ensete ventricosum]
MKPSSGVIDISECAKRLDVDNQISLRHYYRIAHNLLKQADIYRNEKNIIDLFVMLLRFSSLITETIPCHQDYQAVLQNEKPYFRKRLFDALNELEALKPDVQHLLEELNKRNRSQVNRPEQIPEDGSLDDSFERPSFRRLTLENNIISQAHRTVMQDSEGHKLLTNTKEDQFRKLKMTRLIFRELKLIPEFVQKRFLRIPCPKEETLSRHSILGPNGLHGPWQPPSVDHGIQYPSNLDLTPIEMPSLLQPTETTPVAVKENDILESERSMLEVLSLTENVTRQHEERCRRISLDISDVNPKMDIIKGLSPPPTLAEVQDVVVASQVSKSSNPQTVSLQNELIRAESPQEVHISTVLFKSFMELAKSNTVRNLETCGVLAGSLKNRKFYVTALIIPKQEATSNSCQTINEEEIFDYQDKQLLFPLGWIHTHPTQSCFMSSIDLHTQYAYQILLPEAIAIVMAPKDGSRQVSVVAGGRKYGIFRLTNPGGMSVIRQCRQHGFHPHQQPSDGGRIYDHCSNVYMNPKLKFYVVDLR